MKKRKRKAFCILFLWEVLLALNGCGTSFLADLTVEEETFAIRRETKSSVPEEKSTHNKKVYVHVCGCVKNPGLYVFSEGERIDAAIQAAGGFTRKADEQSVNLAEVLVDGTQIYVRSAQAENEEKQSVDNGDQKININVADKTQLMTLNGIGEGRALAILSYREEKGSFSSIEEIKNVSGIGEAIYDRIKNTIVVE